MSQAPCVILNLSACLLCAKKVYQNYVGAGCHEIETKCFKKSFLGEENRCLLLFDLLMKPMRIFEYRREGILTTLSAGMCETSVPVILDWHTLATSRNFLPHSSVLVAKNMHAAATSY